MAQGMSVNVNQRLLVWTPADHRRIGAAHEAMPCAVLAETYAAALRDCANAQALVLPLAELPNCMLKFRKQLERQNAFSKF
jgi:hypothetical protein